MSNDNLKQRTKKFALDVIQFVAAVQRDDAGKVLNRQLLRSGTSVGANDRAACRAKSNSDFINKMGNVEEEADESGYWIDLLMENGKVAQTKAVPLLKESALA